MTSLLILSFDKTARIAATDARHQSSGSCSAHPVCGEANGTCSIVSDATICPALSIRTARDPPVPTSIPRQYIRACFWYGLGIHFLAYLASFRKMTEWQSRSDRCQL